MQFSDGVVLRTWEPRTRSVDSMDNEFGGSRWTSLARQVETRLFTLVQTSSPQLETFFFLRLHRLLNGRRNVAGPDRPALERSRVATSPGCSPRGLLFSRVKATGLWRRNWTIRQLRITQGLVSGTKIAFVGRNIWVPYTNPRSA